MLEEGALDGDWEWRVLSWGVLSAMLLFLQRPARLVGRTILEYWGRGHQRTSWEHGF